MRRGVMLAGIALLAALALAAPAGAITYGTPDGNRHPQVGALLAPQAYSDGTWAACSGTLIAPTVFLTAAHCDLEVDRVAVTFDASYDPATGTEYWGTWHADPAYTQAQNDPHDIAVVVLDRAGDRDRPGPAAGGRVAGRAAGGDPLHLGGLWGPVGDHRPRSQLPVRRRPLCRHRRATGGQPELAADLDEPGPR